MENPFAVPSLPCFHFGMPAAQTAAAAVRHTHASQQLGCQSLMMRPIINLPRGNHLEESRSAPPPPHTLHICNRFAVPLGRQRTSAASLSHSFSPFATRSGGEAHCTGKKVW